MGEDWCCERNGIGCSCHLEDTSCLHCGKEAGNAPFCSKECYEAYCVGSDVPEPTIPF